MVSELQRVLRRLRDAPRSRPPLPVAWQFYDSVFCAGAARSVLERSVAVRAHVSASTGLRVGVESREEEADRALHCDAGTRTSGSLFTKPWEF